MNLRKLANGRDCKVRLYGVCNRDPATVVLAHARIPGTCGVGCKPPDVLAAYACSACHDEVDGRTQVIEDRNIVRLAFYEGVLRTQYEWASAGVLKW